MIRANFCRVKSKLIFRFPDWSGSLFVSFLNLILRPNNDFQIRFSLFSLVSDFSRSIFFLLGKAVAFHLLGEALALLISTAFLSA
jgi:hypothetical protein